MIRADRLTKVFGATPAIREVTFTVASGEVLGFLGPNGAGKSTTLRILSGYLPPTAGAASVDGFDLTRQSLAARRRLGYLPENFSLPAELRVGEYLRFRAGLKGLGRRAARGRVAELADRLGLTERLRQPCPTLSKGYRQRVGLADALLADPPALLLDEPFSGLDPRQRQEFRQLLRDLAADGRSILFSSHVLPEVEDLADRILILHRGRSCAAGSQAELAATVEEEAWLRISLAADRAGGAQDWRGRLEKAFADAQLRSVGGQALDLRLADPAQRDAVFRWLAEQGAPVHEFRMLQPDLEELFLRLVEREEEAA